MSLCPTVKQSRQELQRGELCEIFKFFFIVFAVEISKQCLQTASASRPPISGLRSLLDTTKGLPSLRLLSLLRLTVFTARCICYGKSVRPSVRPSVTLRYCVKTRERRRVGVRSSSSDSAVSLVF